MPARRPTEGPTGTGALSTLERVFRAACLDPGSPHAPLVGRYLSAARLDVLLLDILRGEVARAPGRGVPSGRRFRQHLVDLGLIVPLAVSDAAAADVPHWLVLRGRGGREHDPLQLLCAGSERSIVSHASALVFHDLTQARVVTHFVTVPRERPRGRASAHPARLSADASPSTVAGRRAGPAVGHLLFGFEGREYRRRQAFEDLIFGEKEVWLDELERVRVFDRERTLLHTLTDPECNGGARVVIEAWERAADVVRAPRMLQYLHRLDVPVLWRRVGAMSEHLGIDALTQAAAGVVRTLPPLDGPLPLIRDTTGGRISERWSLCLPW